MGFSPADDERARAGFVVFRSLLRWTDVDLVTLWWVTRSASWLSRTGAGGTYREVFQLIDALRLNPRTPPGRGSVTALLTDGLEQ
jgi:hypothetical protein